MNLAVILGAASLSVLLVALVVLLRRSTQAAEVPVTAAWLQQFNADRYAVMGRLLNEEDFQLIAAATPSEPQVVRSFRASRRRVFRMYLRSARRDFQRLQGAARQILLHSGVDRPDLAAGLMQRQMTFLWCYYRLQWQLSCHALGLAQVDALPLLQALSGIHQRVLVLDSGYYHV